MSTDEIVKAALAEVLASPKWCDMGGLGEDTIYGELALDVAKAVAAAKWKPIETAPRDETPILIYTGMSMFVAVWAYDDKWQPEGLPSMNPTHWMPLPSPPEEGQ